MSSIARLVARLSTKDFYDIVNALDARISSLKSALWYARFFGHIGRGCWLKRPGLIYGPGRIFLGDGVHVEEGVTLYSVRRAAGEVYLGRIQVGDRVFMNRNCNITAAFSVTVGHDVAFGPNVFVSDFDHDYRNPDVSRLETPLISKGPISIGDRCWIGANACIASGVTLGHGCVVGANSVVTRSFPCNTLIAGAPAVAIRRLDEVTGAWLPVKSQSNYEVKSI